MISNDSLRLLTGLGVLLAIFSLLGIIAGKTVLFGWITINMVIAVLLGITLFKIWKGGIL